MAAASVVGGPPAYLEAHGIRYVPSGALEGTPSGPDDPGGSMEVSVVPEEQPAAYVSAEDLNSRVDDRIKRFMQSSSTPLVRMDNAGGRPPSRASPSVRCAAAPLRPSPSPPSLHCSYFPQSPSRFAGREAGMRSSFAEPAGGYDEPVRVRSTFVEPPRGAEYGDGGYGSSIRSASRGPVYSRGRDVPSVEAYPGPSFRRDRAASLEPTSTYESSRYGPSPDDSMLRAAGAPARARPSVRAAAEVSGRRHHSMRSAGERSGDVSDQLLALRRECEQAAAAAAVRSDVRARSPSPTSSLYDF